MSEEQNISTIDKIIEKFVPIIGAILFVTGLGYLIYTSVWQDLNTEIRIGIGFFASFLIIGSGLSFSAKLKYFADIIIGSGILLFYGTLIYGSRATEISQIIIPETATLLTALITTVLISYFASLRKSLVILILGILGAYLTPFVIGQNDVWSSNISFNSYLIYFAMINAVIFILWKEISAQKIIPLNLAGLFFGTITLYGLVYTDNIAINSKIGLFASNEVSVILMAILVILSVVSITFSSKYFEEKNYETALSIGYTMPLLWFLFLLNIIEYKNEAMLIVKIFAYLSIAGSYFWSWNLLRSLKHTRYQHIGTYASWVIAIIFAISNIFGEELNLYGSIFISYIGLFFAIWNLLQNKKWERTLTAIILTFFGAISSIMFLYGWIEYEKIIKSIPAILALLPAGLLFFIDKKSNSTPKIIKEYLKIHSIIAIVLMIIIIIADMIARMNLGLLFLVIPGFAIILISYFSQKEYDIKIHHTRIGLIILSIGFFISFFYLVGKIIPHSADKDMIFGENSIFKNPEIIKTIFAISGYTLAIKIFRKNSPETNIFPLITILFATILLFVNFLLVVFFNEIGIAKETGWIRAISTTIWWIILAIFLLITGIRNGKNYKNEKILGLILLLLTIAKIGLYDLVAMDLDKKIIILMVVGGIIMMFSYFLQVKWYLKISDETEKISENSEKNSSEK